MGWRSATRRSPSRDRRIMKRLLMLFVLLGCHPVYAVTDPHELLPNAAQEKRAERIGDQLRCLVCQNESIEASQAPLAKDLRQIVRQQVASGKSDQAIIDWMVQRYGQFILLRPRFSATTFLLWGSPLLALLVAVWVIWLAKSPAPPRALAPDEQARLNRLMAER
jgi:cytochrome c-type biogenesis protein CcmH